jgi:site-specific DNA-methyltransferase (adenine-specific)
MWTIYVCDVRNGLRAIAPGSVHCAITSPPYWRLRDYGVAGQIGMEATPDEYVANLVEIFEAMKPVLRPDAVFWLNIGDTYIGKGGGGAGGSYGAERRAYRNRTVRSGQPTNLKIGELALVPERLALKLQDAGWFMRSQIRWHKPNAMPESAPDRCARDDEAVWMLSVSRRHYFDRLGEMFPASKNTHSRGHGLNPKALAWDERLIRQNARFRQNVNGLTAERRCRTMWSINTAGYAGAHFAVFPPALPARCLRLTTSPVGVCATCGQPLERMFRRDRFPTRPGNKTKIGQVSLHTASPYHRHNGSIVGNRDPLRHVTTYETTGWAAACGCSGAIVRPAPPIVLDPFGGAMSTGVACLRRGSRFVAIELNSEYAQIGHERLLSEWDRLQHEQRVDRVAKRRLARRGIDERTLFPLES